MDNSPRSAARVPDGTRNRQGARWRLYAYPGGTLTARCLSPEPTTSLVTPADGRQTYLIRRPHELRGPAQALAEYRDDPDAIRSPRWHAIVRWALATYEL